jgi:stearoyl-CoA desaturase (delta-9 desaturase)
MAEMQRPEIQVAIREPVPSSDAGMQSRTVVSSPFLHRVQRRHFLLFDVFPAVGTVAALAVLFVHPIGWIDLTLLFVMWLLTGLSLTVGFHRLFAHGAFKASPALKIVLIIFGSMAARGPVISWAAMHRRHHERSDRNGDLHSPNLHGDGVVARLGGFLHAHYTWMIRHDYPNVAHYVPDLLRDEAVVWANKRYHHWVVLGLVVPAAVAAAITRTWIGACTGVLWGGLVRMFVVEQTMSSINSILHLVGSRPFRARDEHSRNFALLSLVMWGEAWHNNHHAFPSSAAFGIRWYQLDPGFWLIRMLGTLGLVWNIRVPDDRTVAARLAASTSLDRAG